jgi:hypothetical protein
MNRPSYFRNLLMPHARYLVADGDGSNPPAPFDSSKFINEGEVGLGDLPPKDDTPPPPKPKDDTPPPPPKPKDDTPPPLAGTFKSSSLWDSVKEELSTPDKAWELPKEVIEGKKADGTPLTKKEEFEILRKTISSNTKIDDEFVNDYLQAKEKGMPVSEFVKNRAKTMDFQAMSVDDKVRLYYEEYSKSQDLKWTKEDIDAKINALTKVDKDMQAKAFESWLDNKQKAEVTGYVNTQNTKFETGYTKAETENTQHITDYLKNIEGKNTVAGIEFSEAEMAQYKKDLPTFMKREIKVDEKTGLKYAISPAEELLSEILAKPEDTFDLLPYLFMVKNKTLKGYSQRVKENIKKSLENTLDDKPDAQGTRNQSTGFDSDSFRNG